MRIVGSLAAIAVAAALSSGASADEADYSGKWLFSGLILGGGGAMSFAQVRDLQQTGSQFAGSCRGPNGGCSAVGVVNGDNVDLTCKLTVVNNPGLSGVLTFNGAVAPDNIVRGSVTHSRAPWVRGTASMMRL